MTDLLHEMLCHGLGRDDLLTLSPGKLNSRLLTPLCHSPPRAANSTCFDFTT